MSYKVIRPFKDLSDPEEHDYVAGDAFPREGHEPSESFIKGLLTGNNSAGSIFLLVDEGTKETKVPEEETIEEKPKRKRATKKVEE
ncbi:hypothetical protein [Streptococcus pluranimalium]